MKVPQGVTKVGLNGDLVVATEAIHETVEGVVGHIFQHTLCERHREAILDRGLVDSAKVHTHTDFVGLLLWGDDHGGEPL